MGPRLGGLQLYQADGPLPESPFTVGEVEVPEPDEILAVTELGQLRGQRQEAFAPVGQGTGIVVAVIVQPYQLHVGLPRQQTRHLGDAGQAASREDVALDEVHPAQILGVTLIGDGDGLDPPGLSRRDNWRK